MGQKIKKMDFSQINYTPMEGELMQNSEDGHYYVWHDGEWCAVKMDSSGFEMGLYDMNKQIISQMPDLTNWDKAIENIRNLHGKYWNKYYMLYGKEISYFTLFKVCGLNDFGKDVIECCSNVGAIKAMDMTETEDAIEIWVHSKGEEPTCLYLFPYDMGVVEVGE